MNSERHNQGARLLRLFLDSHGAWIPLPEILKLGIAQFGARIFELRRLGFQIENETHRDDSGVIHSRYRLVRSEPERAPTADADSQPRFHRTMSRARRSPRAWKPRPILPQQPALFDLSVRP